MRRSPDRHGRRALPLAVLLLAAVLLVPLPVMGSTAIDSTVVVRLNTSASAASVDASAESQLLQWINDVRVARGLPRLQMDVSLRFVAREHSTDMATHGYVGHGTLSGGSFLDRVSSVVREGAVGENVTVAQTVEEAHTIFLASRGHMQNIVNPVFHRIGIGVAHAGDAGVAVTEDFAE